MDRANKKTGWERTQVGPWVRAIPTTLEFQSWTSNNELVVVLIFENIHYIVTKIFLFQIQFFPFFFFLRDKLSWFWSVFLKEILISKSFVLFLDED